MWNQVTKPLVEAGKLKVIGVVQEQHAERAQLYKQWKQYGFPIAQDAMTSLGLSVVPVPILLDEAGFVLSARPKPSTIGKLVDQPTTGTDERSAPELDAASANAEELTKQIDATRPEHHIAVGDAWLKRSGIPATKKAVRHYQRALDLLSEQGKESKLTGAAHFRLGVAYRAWFDLTPSKDQEPELFSSAADNWTRALELNPNQYIWRRRIQQYGPRQSKPYPFYDWVETAIQEITKRGESPVPMSVGLTESEIAKPSRKMGGHQLDTFYRLSWLNC